MKECAAYKGFFFRGVWSVSLFSCIDSENCNERFFLFVSCTSSSSFQDCPLLLRDAPSLLIQMMLSWPAPLSLRKFTYRAIFADVILSTSRI